MYKGRRGVRKFRREGVVEGMGSEKIGNKRSGGK